jgi:hypothetical protein
VKPKLEEHVVGGAGAGVDMQEAELVPVRQVIDLPSPPYAQAAAALALLLLTVLVAFVGLGTPKITETIPTGTVTLAGGDPTADEPLSLDLSKPIEVRFTQLPAGAESATNVELAMSIAGVPLPASSREPLIPSDQGLTASLDAAGSRYLVAGKVTAELRLLADEQVLLRHEFAATSSQTSVLTIPGALILALVLFLLAYVESLLRPLRRGRRQLTGVFGMAVIGAGIGLVVVPVVWLLGGPEPATGTAVACMVLGALASIVAALAAIRVGKRARIKPKKGQKRVAQIAA